MRQRAQNAPEPAADGASHDAAVSDEELYRQIRKGSQRAFALLYERRGSALYRYALHMSGSRAVAEEVAHEVFLRLIGPHLRFDEERGSLEAYLYGVARNLVRVIRRKATGEEIQEQAIEHDILGDLIRNESCAALYAALDQLAERYRDAVVFCDLEERSYEDAARLMGCPIGTVRSRLHRARILLAARLNPGAERASERRGTKKTASDLTGKGKSVEALPMAQAPRRVVVEI